jgi:hypothetical protein
MLDAMRRRLTRVWPVLTLILERRSPRLTHNKARLGLVKGVQQLMRRIVVSCESRK